MKIDILRKAEPRSHFSKKTRMKNNILLELMVAFLYKAESAKFQFIYTKMEAVGALWGNAVQEYPIKIVDDCLMV